MDNSALVGIVRAAVAFGLGFDANVLKLLKLLRCVTTKTTNKLKCDRKINNPKIILKRIQINYEL